MNLIAQGAEAKIYSDGQTIVKDRFEKTYRHPELDKQLRKSRTKREAKILEKLVVAGICAPKLIKIDETVITMEKLAGKTVKEEIDTLENSGDQKGYLKICNSVGSTIAKMHDLGIIHHDLTTSNMMYSDGKIYFIDFGLSFFSEKDEDKAVDLHLLKRALESRHHRIADKAYDAVVKGYKKSNNADAVLKRLEKVEDRGRNKGKGTPSKKMAAK
jgi:TP53 regulating kinase-like protein